MAELSDQFYYDVTKFAVAFMLKHGDSVDHGIAAQFQAGIDEAEAEPPPIVLSADANDARDTRRGDVLPIRDGRVWNDPFPGQSILPTIPIGTLPEDPTWPAPPVVNPLDPCDEEDEPKVTPVVSY